MMPVPLQLPAAIGRQLENKPYTRNTTGLSGAGVLMFDDCVLKIAPADRTSARETRMMEWLADKLPVPIVLHSCVEKDTSFLLSPGWRAKWPATSGTCPGPECSSPCWPTV